jgi:hypothetical protein
VCLIQGPDDTMMARALAVAAAGTTSRTLTTKLLASAEAMEAMKMPGRTTGSRAPMAEPGDAPPLAASGTEAP